MIASAMLLPFAALAQESEKVVRVGWYESPFNRTDARGRRSGYGYEYQRRIAAYTGWDYEYVEGDWPELMQMLIDGEIDLLSDVSYTEARTELMLFPELPMGSEEYYIFVDVNNREISGDDFSTINGKKAGVYQGSFQLGLFQSWAAANGVQAELVEVMGSAEDVRAMLDRGDIDFYMGVEQAYTDLSGVTHIVKIGASPFYFAVNKARPDLMAELNNAMNRIQSEEADYNSQLKVKYTQVLNANVFLSAG